MQFPKSSTLTPLVFGTALLGLVPQAIAHSANTHLKKPHSVKAPVTKAPVTKTQETLGVGSVDSPAVGPDPSFGIGGSKMVLVKNWHFGTEGTIKNQGDLNANFQYHDQFGLICNGGGNYGAVIVAPDKANAIHDGAINMDQPVEGVNCPKVRQFTADSLKTFLVPLNGAATVDPDKHNAGNGSFQAKWKLPHGGSLLGRDIVWETRVRYVTPPYYWFAIWAVGNKWNQGAEQDVVESFGYDNHNPDGPDWTNYDGHFWHSNSIAGGDTVDYSNWYTAMNAKGLTSYDATQYHTWTWYYKRDNTYSMYVDGVEVQSGSNYYWTLGSKAGNEPIDLEFIFDAGWGHTKIGSVDHPLPASAFDGKFYEWNYSRVYLSADQTPAVAAGKRLHARPSTIRTASNSTGN